MATPAPTERSKALQGILESLDQAKDNESWGLRVEAVEEYQKTVRKLNAAVVPENRSFSAEEKELFLRISQALQLKQSTLQDLSSVQESSSGSIEDVKRIKSALEALLKGSESASALERGLSDVLPHPQRDSQQQKQLRSRTLSDDDYSGAAVAEKAGSLVKRTDTLHGYTYLNITIDKIGLKDPQTYIDPFITISVKSLIGEDIELAQDTPVATQREGQYIIFGVPVEIQRPVEEIPQGSAIFFEFKHYKPKKGTKSTLCFSFMEMDEIKPGKACIEIYKKPTDFHRKKLSLLSVKPLYLHLALSLHKT